MSRLCTLSGCERQYIARGMCRYHYDQQRSNTPYDACRERLLPDDLVREARRQIAAGKSVTEVARACGVTRQSMASIRDRKTYQDVE